MALSGSIHRCPWHTPWTTDLPCSSKDRWKQRQKASVRTQTAIVDSSALLFGTGTSSSPSCSNLLEFPAIHSHFFGFGPRAMRSAVGLARSWFKGGRAQALFAGNSAHAIFPLQHPSSAGFGLMLCYVGPCRWMAHRPWWFPGNCRRSCLVPLVSGRNDKSWRHRSRP